MSEAAISAPASIDVLRVRAEARALLWAEGEIATMPEAVDALQLFAEESGLALEFGQDAVQQILSDAFLPYREAEWQAQADVAEFEQTPAGAVYCDTCGATPCTNANFCAACRAVDARPAARLHTEKAGGNHSTPRVVVEAIVHAVRERGLAALNEPRNVERLAGCDANTKAEINKRIEKLVRAAA
jgi:hypothetical protein